MNYPEIIDYAKPCMDAEKALKDIHNAVLAKDLDKALMLISTALLGVYELQAALRHMKDFK